MPRKARILIPNIPHHITQRGNRKQQTFFSDDDYLYYLNLFFGQCKKYLVDILGFCLMPNHVHLILRSCDTEGMRKAISRTHELYAKHVNKVRLWQGSLWQGRFFSCPLNEEHFHKARHYVEDNPVRANICLDSRRYRWSSMNSEFAEWITNGYSIKDEKFTDLELEEFRAALNKGTPYGIQ